MGGFNAGGRGRGNSEGLSFGGEQYSCVFMLSKGVTASNDSVTPAPKPATTVAGPETRPSLSARNDLYVSKATNPVVSVVSNFALLEVSYQAPGFSSSPNLKRQPRTGQSPLTNTSLYRVSHHQCRTSCIPLPTKWRPRCFLTPRKPPVKLYPCFRNSRS